VAHRLPTLRDADRILVFDDGKIVETGSQNRIGGDKKRRWDSCRRAGIF
jgi:ATP-binding cassette subfamily B protein